MVTASEGIHHLTFGNKEIAHFHNTDCKMDMRSFLYLYVYECFVRMCSVPCVCSVCRDQRKVSDSLALELQFWVL